MGRKGRGRCNEIVSIQTMSREGRGLGERSNEEKLGKVVVKLKDDVFKVDKVIRLFYRDGLLKLFDYESVKAPVTTKERTSALIHTLRYLSEDVDGVPTYELLIKALFRTGQEKLAREIEPEWPLEKTPPQVYVTMTILWMFSDASHLTQTIELLEQVSRDESQLDCSFQQLVEPEAQYTVQRGVFDTTDTEVYCVKTYRSDCQTVATATADAIKKYKPDLVLLSGTCAGKEENTKIGDLVVCKEAFNVDIGAIHNNHGVRFDAKAERPTNKDIVALEVHLESLFKEKTGLWLKSDYQLHGPKISRCFEVYWLTRLYLELTNTENMDKEWLNKIDWDLTSRLKINLHNSKVLQKYLPSWKGGKLFDYLTNSTTMWIPDQESPLRARPTDELRDRVNSGCFFEPDFPQQESLEREPAVIFAPICTNLSVRQDAGKVFEELSKINHTIVACDTNTWGFYQQAAQCQGSQRFMAVKGVVSHADGIVEEELIPRVVRQCGCVLIDIIRYFRNVIGPS